MGFPVDKQLVNLAPHTSVSAIVSEVKLEVDDDGARGAAATLAVVMRGPGPRKIEIDRPFAYCIVDDRTILFQGTVVDESVLISPAQQAKRLADAQQMLQFKRNDFNQTEVGEFLKNDPDWKILMPDAVPPQGITPSVYKLTSPEVEFTLVNFTNVPVGFDRMETKRGPNFPVTFNQKIANTEFVFSPDNCMIVVCPGPTADNVCTISKDIGVAGTVKVVWNTVTGQYKQL